MNFPATEPRWVSPSQLVLLQPDRFTRQLLIDPGSLTRKIVQHCSGSFSVQVVEQQFGRLSLYERKILALCNGETGNIRTVLLQCDQQPWVFAHTVIPHHALRRSLRRLTQLGNRSLGAVLHSSRVMERSHVEYARLLPHHTLYRQAVQPLRSKPAQLWGRRILYRIDGAPLLVHELFLPAFE
jgi:chorismate--pyruvate lyase